MMELRGDISNSQANVQAATNGQLESLSQLHAKVDDQKWAENLFIAVNFPIGLDAQVPACHYTADLIHNDIISIRSQPAPKRLSPPHERTYIHHHLPVSAELLCHPRLSNIVESTICC